MACTSGSWLSSRVLPCCPWATMLCAMLAKTSPLFQEVFAGNSRNGSLANEPQGVCWAMWTPTSLLCVQKATKSPQHKQSHIDKGGKEDHSNATEQTLPLSSLAHISEIKTQWQSNFPPPSPLITGKIWHPQGNFDFESDKLIPWLMAENCFHTALTWILLYDKSFCKSIVLLVGRRYHRPLATLALVFSHTLLCLSRGISQDAVAVGKEYIVCIWLPRPPNRSFADIQLCSRNKWCSCSRHWEQVTHPTMLCNINKYLFLCFKKWKMFISELIMNQSVVFLKDLDSHLCMCG